MSGPQMGGRALRNCAGIDWLGRSKLLTQGGDQAENEAEGRRLQEEFHAKSGCVEEGAACLEGAHKAHRAAPLSLGIQAPDHVRVELLWSRLCL